MKFNNISRFGLEMRPLFLPLGIIALVLVVSVTLAGSVYDNIQQKISKSNDKQVTIDKLNQKVASLRKISAAIGDENQLLMILPEGIPNTWLLSQLKVLSTEKSVFINKVDSNAGKNDSQGVNKSNMAIELRSADVASVLNYLEEIPKLAPLATVESVTLSSQQVTADGIKTDVKLAYYWSGLPTTLPALTEPIKELSPKEQDLLTKVASFRFPNFTSIPPNTYEGRETPFE